MRKLITFGLAAVLTLSSCAQSSGGAASVPAVKMTKQEVNAKLAPFYEKISALPQTDESLPKIKEMALEFVKENQNEAGVYVVKSVLSQVMTPDEFIAYTSKDESLKNDEDIKKIIEGKKVQAATSEGHLMVDFSAEYEGKITKLSDYVGKGKWVLVDFWASWCGPCKREIPNLISVWEKYHGDKFEVLGVATWDKPEDTKKSIEALGIKYPQMLNAQKAGSDAYGINGIPEIILFSPDGKIVKRGLRGEALERAVAEALSINNL